METSTQTKRSYTTKEAAERLRYEAQTVRSVLCRTGSFKGIHPVKLPGGRLLWNAEEIEALASGTLKVAS